MFFSGYEATMLALEANSVIGLRLIKIAHGGVYAVQEVNLMVREKVDAGAEAMAALVGGWQRRGCAGRLPPTRGVQRPTAYRRDRRNNNLFREHRPLALVSRAPSHVLKGCSYE